MSNKLPTSGNLLGPGGYGAPLEARLLLRNAQLHTQTEATMKAMVLVRKYRLLPYEPLCVSSTEPSHRVSGLHFIGNMTHSHDGPHGIVPALDSVVFGNLLDRVASFPPLLSIAWVHCRSSASPCADHPRLHFRERSR